MAPRDGLEPPTQWLTAIILLLNFLIKINIKDGVPKGIRTPVIAVKGRCPRPLDDGDGTPLQACYILVELSGIEPLTSTMPL
jgi:hypothetical protein